MPAAAAGPALAGACRHCGLPTGNAERPFCCYGCSLAFEVAGVGAGGGGGAAEDREAKVILVALGVGAFLTMNVMAFSALLYTAGGPSDAPLFRLFRWLQLFFALPACVLLGLPIARNALRRAARSGMDILILTGVGASLGLSMHATIAGRGHVYYETAAVVLVLVTLGRYLEARARAGAAAELRSLLALVPPRATRIGDDGAETVVEAASIAPGDRLVVRPGEAIAADGEVVEGEAALDASAVTGESRPAPVGPGARVFAGTIPTDGRIVVVARATGEERLMARLARLIEEARSRRAPVERAADRVSTFVLAAAVAVAALALADQVFVTGDPGEGVRRTLAVLLVACPCALGIATPLALWVGLARAARAGALVRSAAALEALAGATAVLFDKTGTLTTGKLALARIESPEMPEDRALAVCASLETGSEHAVGRALVEAARARELALQDVRVFRARPGLGVEGTLADGAKALMGSRRFLEREHVSIDAFAPDGNETTVFLAVDGRARARFGLAETTRAEAGEAIAKLRGLGLEVGGLTGDGEAAAREVGRALEIPVVASLLPDEKVAEIERREEAGARVVFVGDGLNDAPALAAATVGIAVASGTDLAREASPVTLLAPDLRAVPRLIAIARETAATVRKNLFWAFLYNGAGIFLAARGELSPALAAIAMLVSSLLVVGQSLKPAGRSSS